MVIPCNSEYSNRKYCILFIKKIYPERPEGRYPKGYENDSERTNLWEYLLKHSSKIAGKQAPCT